MPSSLAYRAWRTSWPYVIFWTAWACVHLLVLHRLGLDWGTAALDALISNFLLSLVCLGAALLYNYYQPGKTNRIYRLLFALILATGYVAALRAVLVVTDLGNAGYRDFAERSMPVRYAVALLLIAMVTITNWVRNNVAERNHLALRREEAERLTREAELWRLRMQLQPHFLFNALNSISALAGRPEEARRMIQQLSDFLRGTLRNEEKMIPLGEELAHLALYLDIEKVRFGDRLQVQVTANEDVAALLVPSLVLQPIVENAIKHGVYGTTDEITIRIGAEVVNGLLHVEVVNPTTEAAVAPGTGFGLSSTHRRLQLLYSRSDLLLTERRDGHFHTTIRIPFA